jgi:hypothetical protein
VGFSRLLPVASSPVRGLCAASADPFAEEILTVSVGVPGAVGLSASAAVGF